MTTYIDTSLLIKLLVWEVGTPEAQSIWNHSDEPSAARIIVVEARAALAAARRGGRLSEGELGRAKVHLAERLDELTYIEVTAALIDHAADLAEEHALRGDDAVHLASALLVGVDLLTSADAELCRAAEACGLATANPLRRT